MISVHKYPIAEDIKGELRTLQDTRELPIMTRLVHFKQLIACLSDNVPYVKLCKYYLLNCFVSTKTETYDCSNSEQFRKEFYV